MKLNPTQVRHVAKLARLSVTPEEEARLVSQLSVILDAVDALNEVDTTGVPPTTFAVNDGPGPTRADVVRDELSVDAALANAPVKKLDAFALPRVVKSAGDAGDEG